MSNIGDFLDKMYENFLARDLTYIFAGGLLLTNINYACNINIKFFFDYITANLFKFIIFMGVSYFIGIIIQEGLSFINIKTKSEKNFYIINTRAEIPTPYTNYCTLITDIKKHFGLTTLKELERIVYLKQIGSAIGASFFLSSLILLIPLFKHCRLINFILFFTHILFTIICLKENRYKSKQQNDALKALADEINKIKKEKKLAQGN